MKLRDVVLFNITAIVGLRWVTTAAKIGPFALVLWLLAMVAFFIPSAIVVAKLTERDPGEGGIYRWVTTAFGEQHGFLAGWGYWVNNLVYYPSLLVTTAAIGAYALGDRGLALAQSPVYVALFSLAILWFALGLNILGLSVGKWVQNAGGYGTWIPAFLLVVLAAWSWAKGGAVTSFGPSAWIPKDFNYSLLAFFSTMCFGFAGLELASVMGGEIVDPARTIRKGIVISAGMIVAIYVIGTAAVLVALPANSVDITNGVPQAVHAIEAKLGVSWFTVPVAVMLGVADVDALHQLADKWKAQGKQLYVASEFPDTIRQYFPRARVHSTPRLVNPHLLEQTLTRRPSHYRPESFQLSVAAVPALESSSSSSS